MQAQPESIGPYLLETELGSGSHGRVYKAWDPRLSRWVAIKLLYDFQADSLTSEAKLLAELNHPNIVVVYDLILDKGLPALVMEYLPGDNLAARLRRLGPLSWQQSMEYLCQLLAGLAAAHGRQIIHGDLKPENLLFDTQDRLKIGDFGIARREWQPGQAFGSCLSVSPEQIRGESAGQKSDIYAVGLLLYRMLTGKHPFDEGDDQAQMFARMLSQPCPKVPGVPSDINQLLSELLTVNAEARPSAAVLLARLRPPVSQDPTLKQIPVIPQQKPVSRHFGRYGLGIVVVALVLACVWFWPVTPAYVLVPRPRVIDGAELADMPLIRAAVFQGLTEALSRQDNVRMLEVLDESRESSELFKQTAADQMLISELACQRDECALTLSHVDAESRLIKRDTLRFPTDNLLFIGDYVQSYWQVEKSPQAQASNEVDYRNLLTLHESYQAKEIGSSDYLSLLEPYGCRFQLSCGELLSLYRKQARSQRQSEWLDRADQLIESADFGFPPRFLDIESIKLALIRQDFEKADELLTSLEGLFYTDDLVLGLRARWYFQQGFDVKGIAMMARLAEQRPSASNRFNYALMHYRLGQYDEAVKVLRYLNTDMPGYTGSKELLADILFKQGRWAEAAAQYRELLGIKELRTWTNYVNLGAALAMQNQLVEAQQVLNSAYQLGPNIPVVLLNLADVSFLREQKQKSSEYYNKIFELYKDESPKDSWDYIIIALAHARLNQVEGARTALLKAIKDSTGEPLLSFNIALVYLFLGEKEICYDYLEQAIDAGLPVNWLQSPWLVSLAGEDKFNHLRLSMQANLD
ncbi:protein kinase domain-containing protein [Shewanella sp. GXUN23E]|uniref:protein kinase domain-containing protein n=1 Tax=Shewanella sp. GXUN23E TaxID=3422498 RepID=UPI003D7CD90B